MEITYGRRHKPSDTKNSTDGSQGYKPNRAPLTDELSTAAMRTTIARLTEKVERHDTALASIAGKDFGSALFLGELMVRDAIPLVLKTLQGENPVKNIPRVADYIGKDTVVSILQGFAQNDGSLLDLLSPGGDYWALVQTAQDNVRTAAWPIREQVETCLATDFGIMSEPRKEVLAGLATQLTNLANEAIKNAPLMVLDALESGQPTEEVSKIAERVGSPIVRQILESFVKSDDALLSAILSAGKDSDPEFIRIQAAACLQSTSGTATVSRE